MTWIRAYSDESADPRTRRLFDRVRAADGQIDNILRLHALRPHTLEGHMALYKAVLHHTSNRLPSELLEALGVLTSSLNGCDYCERHHLEGMLRGLASDEEAEAIVRGIDRIRAEYRRDATTVSRGEADAGAEREAGEIGRSGGPESPADAADGAGALAPEWEAALRYAARLTLDPAAMERADVERLRTAGFSDGEILEINQVVAYFAYANRTVQGLGATTEGETLGYHPGRSSDLERWEHQ